MKYLVMECGLSYSVVLDSEGRYLKVPNLGYETGQVLRQVVLFETPPVERAASAPLFRWVASAACLLFVLLGGWGFWQMPVGRIRMQINPDIVMVVNSFDRVLYLTGLNKEGDALIEAYSSYAKPYEKVSDELCDRAVEMSYLKDNGRILLTVVSENKKWKAVAEEQLPKELSLHLQGRNVHIGLSSEESGQGESALDGTSPEPIRPASEKIDTHSGIQDTEKSRSRGGENKEPEEGEDDRRTYTEEQEEEQEERLKNEEDSFDEDNSDEEDEDFDEEKIRHHERGGEGSSEERRFDEDDSDEDADSDGD